MTGGIVATSIVFFPAAPFFLFMHGKDITLPKGTEVTTYINGDMNLDPAKFGGGFMSQVSTSAAPSPSTSSPAGLQSTQLTSSTPVAESSTVLVESTPDGADITVDGKYMGSTPSTTKLAPGDHAISVEKSGFKTWQRTMTVSAGGNLTVDATLGKNP